MVVLSTKALTAKEQEESAKRAWSRISSSPESKLQNKQKANRYAALSGDPEDENDEEGMEYQDELEDEFREEIEKGTTEALDTAIEVAQGRTNKLRVDHLHTNIGTNPPKSAPGSGSNGAGTRK